jgi:pimeloyl-ACP methyl ester carboxylesterase
VNGDVEYRVIHGYRRAFRRLGSGPPLLLLHGIGVSSVTWLPVLPALAEHFTVIAPDLLGHGHSDKPRADYGIGAYACGMRDLLSVLDVEKATVVGHSLGGGVAMQFAYQFPERCSRLLLVSSGGVGPQVHPVLRSVVDAHGQVVTMLDRSYLAAGMPTWILWGGRDAIIPVSHAARAALAMPGSRLVFFSEAGHFPHEDEPERFARLVCDFVASTAPAEFDPVRWRELLREGKPPADVPTPAPLPESSGT